MTLQEYRQRVEGLMTKYGGGPFGSTQILVVWKELVDELVSLYEGEEEMKIVLIDWLDAGTNKNVWSDKSDYPDEVGECRAIGFLVKKTDKVVVICQNEGGDQYGNVFVIPRGMIKSIKFLETAGSKKGEIEDINVGDDDHNDFKPIPQEQCTMSPECKCDDCKKETEEMNTGGADRW